MGLEVVAVWGVLGGGLVVVGSRGGVSRAEIQGCGLHLSILDFDEL